MERVLDTHKPPKFASQDVISTMPENVITNILDRLPIQDAVRTCILSTNWKLKWTLLTQLVFDVKFFKYLLLNDNADIFAARIIITKLLHRLKGPITRFVLNKPNLDVLDVGDDENDDDETHPPSPSPHGLTSSEVDCNTLGKLQLQYVKVVCLGSENEIRLIKHVLACSPLLKKIVINTYMISAGKMEFVKKLLKLHRASPIVDVKVSDSCSLLNFLSDSYNQGY